MAVLALSRGFVGRRPTADSAAETVKVHGVEPNAWLWDLERVVGDHPACRLDELLARTAYAESAYS
jgi:hypothetical protein